MRLTLSVDVEIEIEFDYAKDIGTDADMLGRYHMSGPQKHVDKLKAAGAGLKDGDASSSFDVGGKLSPVCPCSLPANVRRCIGVPEEATHYAFLYPATSHGKSMEEALENLDLADELWAFLLLVGGFCYFQEAPATRDSNAGGKTFTLIRSNALVLIPGDEVMDFDGPFTPNQKAIDALRSHGRMVVVTLDVLEEAGFDAFSWVLPNEQPDGIALCPEVDYPFGGFLYQMVEGKAPTFFALKAPTEAQIAEWEGKQKAAEEAAKKPFAMRLLERAQAEYDERQKEIEEMNLLTEGKCACTQHTTAAATITTHHSPLPPTASPQE